MHPRNAGGKRNSQPSTEGDLPEKGSCNEIGQGTLSARSRRGERTSRSTLVPKNNGVSEPNNDPNQKDSILKSSEEVTNEGEHDIYGRNALGRYGSKLLHSTYRIGDEDRSVRSCSVNPGGGAGRLRWPPWLFTLDEAPCLASYSPLLVLSVCSLSVTFLIFCL